MEHMGFNTASNSRGVCAFGGGGPLRFPWYMDPLHGYNALDAGDPKSFTFGKSGVGTEKAKVKMLLDWKSHFLSSLRILDPPMEGFEPV